MIKFFRKIRYDLIEKNKTGRYLKYAIGEIILVVIGILIALQINNANEKNKISIVEQQILIDLQNETISNIENLKLVSTINQRSLENARILTGFFVNPKKLIEISGDSIENLVYALPGALFFPENGILNSITSTGQLSYIRNLKLKHALASITDKVKNKMLLTNAIQELGNKYLDELIYPKIAPTINIKDYTKTQYDARKVYEIPEFTLTIQGTFNSRRQIALKNEEDLMKVYENILTLINQEIDSK